MFDSQLIYDVGMHEGHDTAQYLKLGYRVIAIEANPDLCRLTRERFPDELRSGRLTILNIGITNSDQQLPFHVNLFNSELSSFDLEFASRFGGEINTIQIPTCRFSEILIQYGMPYYIKIDIEGMDLSCIECLTPSNLPKYISVEGHAFETLFRLYDKGYRRFKCINQIWNHEPQRGVNTAGSYRRLMSEICHTVGQSPAGVPFHVLSDFWKKIAYQARKLLNVKSAPQVSRVATSGPFGEDTVGPWKSIEEVAYDWLHLKQGFPWRSSIQHPGWVDFHATYDAPQPGSKVVPPQAP